MNTGLLWFDHDLTNSIQERIFKAAAYFHEKFGVQPNLCYLNPKFNHSDSFESIEIEIKYNGGIQPNHIWLGVKE